MLSRLGWLPTDPPPVGFVLYDLEGELFFGAAPELARNFERIALRAKTEAIRHVLLRLKRVRNPDVVSLEQFEHFLKEAEAQGLMIWLAGVQADLLESFRCLGFSAWLPNQRIFPQGGAEDSATLAAMRGIRAELKANTSHAEDRLYYLM